MPRDVTRPTVDQYGAEEHPAFGVIHASRGSQNPGAVLFQSDTRHQHSVRIVIEAATRKRDLNHDYVHGGKALVEVELSEAQWASFVSSMNTSGVPCTIRRTESGQVPALPYDPRLAHSMAEVKEATRRTYERVRAAMDAYDALPKDAGIRARRDAIDTLRLAIRHVEPNLTFTASSLDSYAEDVVQRARADIEAMVAQEATRLGLTAGEATLLELPAIEAGS